MFTNVKNALVRKKYIRLLGTLVAAFGNTEVVARIVGIAQKDAQGMFASEPTFLSVNPAAPDAQGNVQVMATQAGVDAFNAANAAAAAAAQNTADPAATAGDTSAAIETFEISSEFALTPIQRKGHAGGRESKYPFMKLELGQSFFVATTPKAFASTLSGGNRKGKKETPVRRFTLRSVDETAQGRGKGIRVWRVEPLPPKAAKVAPAGTTKQG